MRLIDNIYIPDKYALRRPILFIKAEHKAMELFNVRKNAVLMELQDPIPTYQSLIKTFQGALQEATEVGMSSYTKYVFQFALSRAEDALTREQITEAKHKEKVRKLKEMVEFEHKVKMRCLLEVVEVK